VDKQDITLHGFMLPLIAIAFKLSVGKMAATTPIPKTPKNPRRSISASFLVSFCVQIAFRVHLRSVWPPVIDFQVPAQKLAVHVVPRVGHQMQDVTALLPPYSSLNFFPLRIFHLLLVGFLLAHLLGPLFSLVRGVADNLFVKIRRWILFRQAHLDLARQRIQPVNDLFAELRVHAASPD
jgi:hypothetical protein